MNTELLEEKYNLNQTIFILNNVMKKYDTYDRNLLKEILKYNTLCSCELYALKNLYNIVAGKERIICWQCNKSNIKRKEINKNYIMLFHKVKNMLIFILIFLVLKMIKINDNSIILFIIINYILMISNLN
jgi:hypothetical protein